MNIPDDLLAWKDEVLKRGNAERIVENLESEERVDGATEKEFWKRLKTRYRAARRRKTDPKPEDFLQLLELSTVGTPSQKNLFLEGDAAKHGETILGHLEPVLRCRFRTKFMRGIGLHSGNEVRIAQKLKNKKDAITEMDIGRRGGIAWAFFPRDIDPITLKYKRALETLGMALRDDTPVYVYWKYDASGLTTHCPTVLDAGKSQFFQPTPKTSSTGMTRPTEEGLDAVREVVHRSAKVPIRGHEILEYDQP